MRDDLYRKILQVPCPLQLLADVEAPLIADSRIHSR